MKVNKRKVFERILFYIVLLIIWQIIFMVCVEHFKFWKPYTFPSPIGVFESFLKLSKSNVLTLAIVISIKRMLIGYTLSMFLGVLLGIIILNFNILDENLKPIILGIQTLPNVCWIPFAILWFGLNESSIIFVIILGSAFSICISVESAVKNINPLYIKAAGTMGVNRLQMCTKIIFPASMPNVVSGLKQGWSFAWRALMAGEMLSASKGLGQILMIGRELSDINQMMCIIIVIIMIGCLMDYFIFGKIEKNVRKKWGFL